MLPNNSEMLLVGGSDRNLSLYTKDGTRLAPLLNDEHERAAAGDSGSPSKDASGSGSGSGSGSTSNTPVAAAAAAADPGSNWLLCAAKRELSETPQIVRCVVLQMHSHLPIGV